MASMSFDISHLLEGWDYEPGQIVVRKFKTRAGIEKIQLRLDLGLLQMNALGRPDGKRPFGRESLLEHHTERLKRYQRTHGGNSDGFTLSPEECAKLQHEAIQFHHRYICLFQLQDFSDVIRDTERNLKAFGFIRDFAATSDVAWPLQHLIPQLIMLRTRAKGMLAVEARNHTEAVHEVEEGLDRLRQFYHEFSRAELIDHSGEIQSLDAFLKEIQSNRPLSERERLEVALQEAVRREDYEKAAEVRDLLRTMDVSKSS
jgi:hypothetical protein